MAHVVSFRDYVDARIDAVLRDMEIQFAARDRVATREITVQDAKFEKVNDIRAQLTTQYTGFTTQFNLCVLREEYGMRNDQLSIELRRIENRFDHYATATEHAAAATELRALSDWKSNVAGRVWALSFAIAAGSAILNLILRVYIHV